MNQDVKTINITPKKWLAITLALTILTIIGTRIPTGYGYEILWLLLFGFAILAWLGIIVIILQHYTDKTKP
jgi:Na+/H+ antiporter NhaA